MPFSNRERPRLSERLRGKSGQDLFNEVKSALNSDSRRMFFDTPSWSNRPRGFSRGFPFDDEEPLSARSFLARERGREQFGENPIFADRGTGIAETFHEPPWDEDSHSKKRVVEPESPQQPAPSLNQHGLRNTVPFTQQPSAERPARAMSAPPGDRPARFTSTCEIPVMGDPQPQQPPAQQQPTATPNNVRVIPIQVEGRDEPLVNSNIDMSTNFATEAPVFDARLPRDFGPFRKHSARFQQSPPHQQQPAQPTPKPPHKQSVPKQQPQAPPQPQSNQRGTDEPDRAGPPPPVDPTAIALGRIADVHREVEELAKQVETANVTTRKDKQYVYLDEMLTRQLLRLDDVDPAGQDNIRQARRDAIRAIQNCISVLESKVPGEAMEVDLPSESPTVAGDQTEGNQEGEMLVTDSQVVTTADDPAPPTTDPPA